MVEWLADENGILLRRTVIEAGLDDKALTRAHRAGRIVRLRQGGYALCEVWENADAAGRHRLLVGAVRQQYDDSVAISHTSAHVEYGGPTWGLALDAAHLTHLDGTAPRRGAKIVHHRGACYVGDLGRDDAGWITTTTRTALDTAAIGQLDPAVAVLEWYLNRGLVTSEGLWHRHDSMRSWANTLHLQVALRLAGDRSESVGETRVKLLCRDQGLPAPLQQYEVRRPDGRLAGRVDFAWPGLRVLLEFDGLQKYHRFRRAGESLEEMIMREKRREDLIRELTGWVLIRLTWADLGRPAATAARIRRAFVAAAA
ncbi:type IV toxin-antitoxin system AbiEi family antitoxin domain-containing protein [Nocardioides sp. BGMRC 2183]|nr:type IV toxin-antitoxin system AbiEi family antitoxin domain-containing protein [Nocardioides sp. BGMRC 2183]